MDFQKTKRALCLLAVVYWVMILGIYVIGYEPFHYHTILPEAPAAEYVIGEVVAGEVLTQPVCAPADTLTAIGINAATYGRENQGLLTVVLRSGEETLTSVSISLADLFDNNYTVLSFPEAVSVTEGQSLTVELRTTGTPGNTVTFYAGNTVGGQPAQPYLRSGVAAEGGLCLRLQGQTPRNAGLYLLLVAGGLFALLLTLVLIWWRGAKKGKNNPLSAVSYIFNHYSFLMRQLVSRDFKTKYKRSYLGMVWSVMNPLLNMAVQYVVFSTLFRSNIPNYPVYLLSGIVFFNFFNEALTMGMTAITSNAPLIKKVYMPKYIYPVSRVLSSLVNFGLSLIPLALVMVITGTPMTFALLLLIFDIGCYLAFIIGMTFLLSSAMTFFQDTQFLWSVVSLMWQYLTPVFYPESIIPPSIMPFYRLNPMYHYLSFARSCIIDGAAPSPETFVWCLGSALAVLGLGIWVFRKNQNKFVMYL